MIPRAYGELGAISVLKPMQMLFIELHDLLIDFERGGDGYGRKKVFELVRIVLHRERRFPELGLEVQEIAINCTGEGRGFRHIC
jgi:hypothetical protein